ncbi:hypothetical protein [Acidovorax sp. BLS4]|uniref:hypothetical protein n=1 Tax=Acidovorax sp. BLS4 TaxID=3273430 RepID=UPI002943CE9F|nr:hypothetical protein [Paracidovorax avenae]WOI47889.1 hypothetical protein R1Z03_12015 [Paracidovorax avenae]
MTASYTRAMLAATPEEMLVGGKKTVRSAAMSQEQVARMENEMTNLFGAVQAGRAIAQRGHAELDDRPRLHR